MSKQKNVFVSPHRQATSHPFGGTAKDPNPVTGANTTPPIGPTLARMQVAAEQARVNASTSEGAKVQERQLQANKDAAAQRQAEQKAAQESMGKLDAAFKRGDA